MNKTRTRLSKSSFQKGLQCEKALWLSVHAPGLADPVSESKQWIFDQGTDVGILAQQLFPNGAEVAEGHRQTEAALVTTQRLLAEGVTTLYEPAFLFDGVLVRVDILVAAGDGSWDLYEVKSSTRLKAENITDAAIQTYVVEGSGLPVRRAHIVHVDNSYVWQGGEYDLEQLFAIEDVTQAARERLPEIPALLERFREMLAGPEPDVRIGGRCKSPYACDFSGHCNSTLACERPVTGLLRVSERTLHALLELGVTDIREIPEGFEPLSAAQRRIVEVVKRGEPWIDPAGLARDLAQLSWPVYHLDFETVMPALPQWPGTRPYEQIPFQYSVHVHHEDGTFEHREYLHTDAYDPRRPLAERLVRDLECAGTVMHYTRFERDRLTDLARALPDLAAELDAISERLVDLERIVRMHTLHPATFGYTSIKAVLPAWCPDLSYDGLGIADGLAASALYLRALRGKLGRDETEKLYVDLIDYCGLDTLAMARLLEVLRGCVSR